MGKLVWAAIGFAAAALAAEYFLPINGLPYLAAALVVLSPCALFLRSRRRTAALLVLLSAGAGLLFWWIRYELRVAPMEELAGSEAAITARVRDYPEEGDHYTGLSVVITDGAPERWAYVYVYDSSAAALEPGDEIALNVRFISAMNAASGDRRHTYTARGISVLARAVGQIEHTGRWRHSWLCFPQRLAHTVKRLCGELFAGDTYGFMTALLIGDRDKLYDETQLYSDMRSAGVMHIVAVSGMHLVILISFLQILLGRSRRTSLISLPVMLVFVFMAGCSASVVRAALMETVMLFAPIAGREYDGPSGLSAALLVILIGNPMAIGGAGLQLSFACALGFALFMDELSARYRARIPAKRFISRLLRGIAAGLACTLCASVFTIPLAAYYFGVIPLLSWLANLLTLPIVEILFAGGYAACAAGALLPFLGKALAWILSWGVRWCALVYRLIASVPFGCLYTVRPAAVVWLVCLYALFIAWYILRKRGIRISFLIPAEISVILFCIVFLTGGVSLRSGAEIDVLDVGQGECVVMMDETAAVVIDCGGTGRMNAGDKAANWLRSSGKNRVDVLVLSHLHEDHTNGVTELMARMPVSNLILPADNDDEDRMLDDILAAAEHNGTNVLFLEEECAVSVGGLTLTFLLPEAGSGENDRGIVTLAAHEGLSALVMGDAGQRAEFLLLSRGHVPDVDLLVVGHHGSNSSSGLLFLKAARAETSAISVGAGNAYGHPGANALSRISASGSTVLRTDEDGNITIRQRTEDLYG